jgi:beta-lactamase class A
MVLDRRDAIALGVSALLAACSRRTAPGNPPHSTMHRFDPVVLDQGFASLAKRALPGAFAMGVLDLKTNETWFWNTDRGFPLTSAVAAPVVAAALWQVDAGKLALGQAAPLMAAAIDRSEGAAIDALMSRVGGPAAVTAWLQQKGVAGLRVDRSQSEILADLGGAEPPPPTARRRRRRREEPVSIPGEPVPPERRQAAMDDFIVDPRDSSTVQAALGFLALLTSGALLSPRSTDQLISWMYQAPGGLFRTGLPAQVSFARALGATPTDLGFTPSVAEMGIANWPGGRAFALAGFLVGSTATADARNLLFADAARLASRAIG